MSNPPPSGFSPHVLQPRHGETIVPPPPTTAHGALLAHITGGHIETIDAGPSSFQPMNVNFGLFPPIAQPAPSEGRKFGRGSAKNLARKSALSARALADLERWIAGELPAAAAE
jgi:methylenetetrahydrofolate--tRNA-(uracil-5-)-methyltransferase